MSRLRWICSLAVASVWVVLASCGDDSAPGDVSAQDQELMSLLAQAGVTAPVPPQFTNADQIAVGRFLFFDKILSGNRNISCATCHTPSAATADGLSLSIGEGGTGSGANRVPNDAAIIPRNAPVTFDRSMMATQFFDGRVRDNGDGTFDSPAGDQLLPGLQDAFAVVDMFPVTDRGEMRGQAGDPDNELAVIEDDDLHGIWAALTTRILAIPEYGELLGKAYPEVERPEDFTFVHIANAMSAFQATAFSAVDSRFDDYLDGDLSALSDGEKRGAILFFGDAGCGECHGGPLLSDFKFHNRAVPQLGPGKGEGPGGVYDFGRESLTGDPGDKFTFRTPPLRNVAVSGPWFHDGAFTTLAGTVRHELDPVASAGAYDPDQLHPLFKDLYHPDQTPEILAAASAQEIRATTLTDDEVGDILNFLNSLTSQRLFDLPNRIPPTVPSGLPVKD